MLYSLFQDKEIAVMCVLLGIILVLTLFHRQFIKLLGSPTISSSTSEGFAVGMNGVSQEVKNFIRLASFTRDGQTGMMNTLHLDTRKVVNPDTDVVVIESPLVELMHDNSASSGSNNPASVFTPPTDTALAGATVKENNVAELFNNNNTISKGEGEDEGNDEGEGKKTNKNTKLEISKSDRKLLLNVGARREGKSHMTDYYLDADNGLDITLDMKFNSSDVPANTDELPATLVIQEVGTGKTYNMENPRITFKPMRPNVLVIHTRRRSDPKDWDGKKYTVIQEFNIELYFTRPVSELLTGEDAVVTDSFRSLINDNLSLAQSSVTYTLYVPEVLEMDKPLYSIRYYLRRGEVNRQPVSQIAHQEVKAITDEILTERVPNIITPMYILDHQISKMENVIGAISDEYRSRQLEERQRQLQFYDTYA